MLVAMNSKLFVNNPFFSEVESLVESALRALILEKIGSIDDAQLLNVLSQLNRPPESKMGHAALPCHGLSKLLRMPPIKIADFLKEKISLSNPVLIERVESVAGYLNFFAKINKLGESLIPKVIDETFFKGDFLGARQQEKIIIEYSQPNTHKALHVGHLRNVVYGDAVCGILEYVGHKIVRATYPGDMGTHIAKTLWYIDKFKSQELAKGDADWLGQIYVEATEEYKKSEGSPLEKTYRDDISVVLRQLQEKKGTYYDLYLKTREWSLNQMRELYKWLGTHFDVWFYESECDEPSRELVVRKFKDGFFKESEGAIGLDLNEYGLGFALYLKSDGNGLYLTKDLELIRRKFEDPSITRSIVIVDSRQKLHFKQLFKTAELMGYPQAVRSVHLSYENVLTEDGAAFSSRSKNGLGIRTLRKSIENQIHSQFLERHKDSWSEEDLSSTATQIALGALKYGMLKVDGSNTIRFVLSDWVKIEGETGPYLQYAGARAKSLLEKLKLEKKLNDTALFPTSFEFSHPVETDLLLHISAFNKYLQTAADEFRPSVLTAYLYDLCKLFNHFYKECPIKDASNDNVLRSRAALTNGFRKILNKGFEILNIPLPSRM
jgi:arginyl-tRNA synthetase